MSGQQKWGLYFEGWHGGQDHPSMGVFPGQMSASKAEDLREDGSFTLPLVKSSVLATVHKTPLQQWASKDLDVNVITTQSSKRRENQKFITIR